MSSIILEQNTHHSYLTSITTESINNMLQIETVQSLFEFGALANEWQTLLHACDEDNLSLDHAWLLTYLQYFPPIHLRVFLVRNAQGELVAAARLKVSRNPIGVFGRILRSLEFIGGNAPCIYDHIQFLIHPDVDKTAAMNLIASSI